MWTKLLKALVLCVITLPLLAISNPIMIIRCGTPSNAPASLINSGPCGSNTEGCSDGYICVNGNCVEVCSFVSPVCISDCDEAGGTLSWNSSQGACECVDESEEVLFICCPTFLSTPQDDFAIDVNISRGINLGESYCYIPGIEDCYDGSLTVQIPPLLCNSTMGDSVEVTVLLLVENGACVSITDLQNCELTNGQNFVLLLAAELGATAAFCDDDSDGTIELIFKRDPATETVLDFGDLGRTVIPACPNSAFDPCSCSNPNVVNAAGTVLYWADTMVFNVIPGSSVYLCDNRNGDGFLDPTTGPAFTPYLMGSLLGSDGDNDGIIRVPFFIAPGEDIDIEWSTSDACDVSQSYFGGCNLAVTACLPAVAIPTMGQWAVYILGLLLLITGVVAYRTGWVSKGVGKIKMLF